MSKAAQPSIRHPTASDSGMMVPRRSLDQTVSMTGDMNGSSSHEATVRPTPSKLHKYIKRESKYFHKHSRRGVASGQYLAQDGAKVGTRRCIHAGPFG